MKCTEADATLNGKICSTTAPTHTHTYGCFDDNNCGKNVNAHRISAQAEFHFSPTPTPARLPHTALTLSYTHIVVITFGFASNLDLHIVLFTTSNVNNTK